MSNTDDAARVQEEFRRQHFDVGPLVANNFAISGTRETFARYFGEEAVRTPGHEMLSLDAVPTDLRKIVQTIGFTTGY